MEEILDSAVEKRQTELPKIDSENDSKRFENPYAKIGFERTQSTS
ncbi:MULTISPECIES: hypothetical protein [Fibrobacter]|nr:MULTISPECIES: hypothetical protein [Fibrobacter]MDD7298401.1 hypothetical protein [Fibrobacter intestinalis]